MERFPSGQREQTVNLLSVTSVVRIHPSPPRKSVLFGTDFLFQDNPLPFSSIFVALPRRKSLLSVHTRTKTPATIPQIVCLLSKRRCAFFVFQGCGFWLFFLENSRTLCVPNHLSVLTASKERCKCLHLQISRAADIDGGCTHRVQFAKQRLCKQSNRRRRRLSSPL